MKNTFFIFTGYKEIIRFFGKDCNRKNVRNNFVAEKTYFRNTTFMNTAVIFN